MNFRVSIDGIAETMRNAKGRGRACSLLIGAGCSVKAGIPAAAGIVDVIKERYPYRYGRAEQKTYPICMSELHVSERRDLIAEYVDRAKINWAHICIALLMQQGYVDRVLTTNFDLLVVRACSMLGEFPASYDLAASQLFKAADIPGKAVFYLHGQRTGFVLINTDEDYARHSKLLAPVFEDAGRGRVWIVVGYSGESDPVFEHLANVPRFDNGLYWVGYRDAEPAKHVLERLLQAEKDALYANGYDADTFFLELTRKLGIFPPAFIVRPFSYLGNILEMLTPFPSEEGQSEQDVTVPAREKIQAAIKQHELAAPAAAAKAEGSPAEAEKEETSPDVIAMKYFLAGQYDRVLQFRSAYDKNPTSDLAYAISWAYVMQGVALRDQAKAKAGREADSLFAQAMEKYKAALQVKPDHNDAYNEWGNALLEQARTGVDRETDQFLMQAIEKYQAALQIKPDYHHPLGNWGLALSQLAETRTGEEADQLVAQAIEKYQAALQVKPDYQHALNNWGLALFEQAKIKTGQEAERLLIQAIEKYQAALQIKPDYQHALNNWGRALFEQAKIKTGQEAERLLIQAIEKYQAALQIKPDYQHALNNWGLALSQLAENRTGEEADQLVAQAIEKYQAALQIKPDYHHALNNWALALSQLAETTTGEEADQLVAQAIEKYQAALQIKPDYYLALNNWGVALLRKAKSKAGVEAEKLFEQAREKLLRGEKIKLGSGSYNLACISALQGDEEGCRKWLENSKKYGTLLSPGEIMEDPDLDSVRGRDWFKALLAG